MKFPNWFRILWWVILLSGITLFLKSRLPDLISGSSTPADIVVFLVWIALCLLPLVAEINILGIKLKKEVEAIHKDLSERIEAVRNDIQNTIDVRSQFNPQFTLHMPPLDSQLPAIEEQVRVAINNAMNEYGIQRGSIESNQIAVSETERFMFAVRNNIERELRRIYSLHFPNELARRYSSIISISRVLTNHELPSPAVHPKQWTSVIISLLINLVKSRSGSFMLGLSNRGILFARLKSQSCKVPS